MKKIKFNPGIRITIFFVFFAILFFSLGLWQIERGQSKEDILEEFENNITKNPSYLNKDSKKWDRVFVEGTWIGSKQIYIDNVIYGGMAGYKVLTPLKIKETNELLYYRRYSRFARHNLHLARRRQSRCTALRAAEPRRRHARPDRQS